MKEPSYSYNLHPFHLYSILTFLTLTLFNFLPKTQTDLHSLCVNSSSSTIRNPYKKETRN